MNCPQSNPFLAVIPLHALPESPPLQSMDPARYCIFLNGRLTEQEFAMECANMKSALLTNKALVERAAGVTSFANMIGAKGCTTECCCVYTGAMLCCGIPIICLAMSGQSDMQQLRNEWLRVMQGECSRMSAAYGSRGLRFDLGEETRVTGYTGKHHTPVTQHSAWIAITIAPVGMPMQMQMAAVGAMQMMSGMPMQMPMQMQVPYPQQPMQPMQPGAAPAAGQPQAQTQEGANGAAMGMPVYPPMQYGAPGAMPMAYGYPMQGQAPAPGSGTAAPPGGVTPMASPAPPAPYGAYQLASQQTPANTNGFSPAPGAPTPGMPPQ